MPSVSPCPPFVQAQYTPPAGIVLRIDGKSRLASLDELEQDYGQPQLDQVLSNPKMWLKLTPRPTPKFPSTHTCRCWASYRGDNATIILPTIGKVVIPVTTAAAARECGDRRLLDIFNCVLQADVAARQNAWRAAKPHIELSDEEVAVVEAVAGRSFPRLVNTAPVPRPALVPQPRPAA